MVRDKSKLDTVIKQYGNKDNMETLLNRRSISSYNCWGFTAVMVGWETRLHWIHEDVMTDLLLRNSVTISESDVQNGDILVYSHKSDKLDLSHTAIMVDKDKRIFIHKPGGGPLELQDICGTLGNITYDGFYEYRRPK